jgi:glycosyltransferase involved in cell wall biosynthesis
MRIAQVAPLYESVPPKLYGGTERIVSHLTEELVKQGHDLTLFATGDSLTQANLVPICPQALRLNKNCVDQLAPHILMLEMVLAQKHEFDIIHFHIDYLHFPLTRNMELTALTTLHGRLDVPELAPLYREFREVPVSSISDTQRKPLPWLNWQGTIYHGLPENQFAFHPEPGQYLAFLGRISPEKGLDQAIAIAKRAGIPLKIAAKIDRVDQQYFASCIRPLLQDPSIEFLGEIGFPEKDAFLGGAAALLFPVVWPEPFGIVMIEAMACGTPVIAYPQGSVPEVLEDGMTGFLVHDVAEAIEAVQKIPTIDRATCRQRFEERFTSSLMSSHYLQLYETILRDKAEMVSAPSGVPIG